MSSTNQHEDFFSGLRKKYGEEIFNFAAKVTSSRSMVVAAKALDNEFGYHLDILLMSLMGDIFAKSDIPSGKLDSVFACAEEISLWAVKTTAASGKSSEIAEAVIARAMRGG